MQYAWTCSCCGKQFDTLPLDWAFEAPAYWNDIPEAERAERGKLSSDFCVADEHLFIRGCLQVPIIGFDDKLVWGVWVSQSAASFRRAQELFDRDPEPDEKPRFGWLSNGNSHLSTPRRSASRRRCISSRRIASPSSRSSRPIILWRSSSGMA